MADGEPIWVCAVCHSVNKIGAKQCYKCRTPKEHAAFDPTTEDIGSRTISLPDFHPSRPAAMLATVLILVIAVLHAINSLVGVTIILRVVEGDLLSEEEVISFGVMGLATFGIALIALTGWAFWLSKAVRTMPALGLGYPAANGLMAFYENFIPVLNLWRVPAIVRDMVHRLEPGESRGTTLISAAWVGLIAGYLLPRFGGFVNNIGSETFEGYVRNLVIIQLLSLVLVLTGSVLLVVLIWWIEGRILRRQTALSEAGPEGVPPQATAPGLAAAQGRSHGPLLGPRPTSRRPRRPSLPPAAVVRERGSDVQSPDHRPDRGCRADAAPLPQRRSSPPRPRSPPRPSRRPRLSNPPPPRRPPARDST